MSDWLLKADHFGKSQTRQQLHVADLFVHLGFVKLLHIRCEAGESPSRDGGRGRTRINQAEVILASMWEAILDRNRWAITSNDVAARIGESLQF